MKKLLLLMTALLMGVSGAWADADYTGIKLTFNRTSTTAADVVVTDQDGNSIAGVTATLESFTHAGGSEFKTGSAAALSRTTNSVLAPSTGYGQNEANASTPIVYTIKVQGLSTDFVYNTASLDVYALTGGGANQYNNGDCVRYWTLAVATGETEEVADYISQAGNDICTVPDNDGGLYHKAWYMPAANKTATSTLYIKVSLTKTSSDGCFAGLGAVMLTKENIISYAADASYGSYTAKNTYGTFAQTWVSSTTPALTLTNSANNINIPDGGLYNSTYTLSVPDGYIITGYSFKATPSDGTTTTMTVTPEGAEAISIPADGTTIAVTNVNWASTTFTTVGRYIKVSNFYVTYAVDPRLSYTCITDLENLSNDKVYLVSAKKRGTWYFNGSSATSMGVLTSYDRDDTDLQLAIIKQNDQYYLYSVAADKYLTKANTLYDSPLDPVTITTSSAADGNYKWFFSFGSNHNINIATNPIALTINNWSTHDEGNMCAIIEAADFNNTDALAAFTNYDKRFEDYYNYHSEIGTNLTQSYLGEIGYPTTGSTGYTNLLGLVGKSSFTETDYNNLPTYYAAFLAETNIKTPEIGNFYRIKGSTKHISPAPYLTGENVSSAASENRAAYSTTASTNTIWYYNTDNKFVNYGNGGYYAATTSNNIYNPYDASVAGQTFAFQKAGNNEFGEMNLKFGNRYLYVSYKTMTVDGVSTTYYYTDSGTSLNSSHGYNFVVEKVTSLPVTISAAGYATFYAPVALTVPEGVTAYVAADKGDYLSMTEVSTTIPANTGVILAGEAGTYNFAITTGGSVESNALTGTVAAISRPKDSYILATGSNGVGFYADGAMTIPGFKAYLASSANVRGFLGFNFDEQTVITAIEAAQNPGKAVYDLNGRRVENPAAGIYIVNGKKVIINKK